MPSADASVNSQSRCWLTALEYSAETYSNWINGYVTLSNLRLSWLTNSMKSSGNIILLLKPRLILLSFVKLLLFTLTSWTLKTAPNPDFVSGFSFNCIFGEFLDWLKPENLYYATWLSEVFSFYLFFSFGFCFVAFDCSVWSCYSQ